MMTHTDDVKTSPHDYWSHCHQEWKNVRDGAHMAGNLSVELFFEDLQDSAQYVDELISRQS